MRLSWDDYFLEIASVVAKRSTCPRLNVGCVITLNNKILTTGYNGAPPKYPHCEDVGCEVVNNHCTRVVHAEINALNQLSVLSKGIVLYSSHSPCTLCLSEILRRGIKEIHWGKRYDTSEI